MNREILLKILSFLTTIGVALSGWFFNDAYAKMDAMREDITSLQLHRERVESSQFSVTDFIKARDIIDSQIVATDKRVIALEESQKTIKEYLSEIKGDVKEIKAGQR